MKVILLEDVKNVGKARDIKDVKPGYGQNYLIRNGLALEATKENMDKLNAQLAEEKANEEKLKAEAIKNKDILEKTSFVIKSKLGPDGRLYGAITNKEVGKTILDQTKIDLDKRKIVIKENIKVAGSHSITIKLYKDVDANITLVVKGE